MSPPPPSPSDPKRQSTERIEKDRHQRMSQSMETSRPPALVRQSAMKNLIFTRMRSMNRKEARLPRRLRSLQMTLRIGQPPSPPKQNPFQPPELVPIPDFRIRAAKSRGLNPFLREPCSIPATR